MALMGSCPDCGAKAPLSAFAQGPEAGRVMEAQIAQLDKAIAARLIPYLRLHAPPGRALNWNKAGRLIEELVELTKSPVITWERQSRPATPQIWAAAMDKAVGAAEKGELDLPLDGHGWLRKVAWSDAGKAARDAEQQREALARGETPIGQSPAHRPFTPSAGQDRDAELRDLISQRNSLQRLSRTNPDVHAEHLIKIETRIAEIRAMHPTQPGESK